MRLGTNLSFSVKRWVEPESWARVVRQDLDLDLAQFSFDIVDPWWPQELRSSLAGRIRKAVDGLHDCRNNKWMARADNKLPDDLFTDN